MNDLPASANRLPKLVAQNVSVHYRMKRTQQTLTALAHFQLSVAPGEFVCLVGPSGCGKTTFLHVVAGLLAASEGRVLLDGREITGPGRDRAMVFQSPALFPWRSVWRNIAYGLELQGQSQAQARTQAQTFIDLVGLTGFEESYPNELSGGMQQRANLARALVIQPQLLLLDEPLAELDAQTREHMQAELQRIWLETGHAALFVTHQIDEAIFLADRVVVLSARPGRIKAIVAVDLPRPRSLSVKRSLDFLAIEDHIWSLLESAHERPSASIDAKRR